MFHVKHFTTQLRVIQYLELYQTDIPSIGKKQWNCNSSLHNASIEYILCVPQYTLKFFELIPHARL